MMANGYTTSYLLFLLPTLSIYLFRHTLLSINLTASESACSFMKLFTFPQKSRQQCYYCILGLVTFKKHYQYDTSLDACSCGNRYRHVKPSNVGIRSAVVLTTVSVDSIIYINVQFCKIWSFHCPESRDFIYPEVGFDPRCLYHDEVKRTSHLIMV